MAITPIEAALRHALRRVLEECPPDTTWPPAVTAYQNATDMLAGRISPQAYLQAVTDRREVA